jgi:5-formyltetrahydrofolate cyclo-ligase
MNTFCASFMPPANPTPEQSARRELRAQMRTARCALTIQERRQFAEACAHHLLNHCAFRNARRLAAYLPADGELDSAPLIERAWEMGKRVYLPVLLPHGENRLWFARYTPDTKLIRNRFGIPEPARATHTRIAPLSLDLVLAPLVAFDAQGHRLGMGGGFYDRSFAYLLRHARWLRPRLIGLAYDFQRQSRLPAQAWDVPLQAIATDHRIYLSR